MFYMFFKSQDNENCNGFFVGKVGKSCAGKKRLFFSKFEQLRNICQSCVISEHRLITVLNIF